MRIYHARYVQIIYHSENVEINKICKKKYKDLPSHYTKCSLKFAMVIQFKLHGNTLFIYFNDNDAKNWKCSEDKENAPYGNENNVIPLKIK